MSGAFTPGPWVADQVTPESAHGFVRIDDIVVDGMYRGGDSDLLRIEDARLIASAPDLHAIVSRLASLVDGLNNGNSAAEIEACRLAEQARALLSTVTTTKDAA